MSRPVLVLNGANLGRLGTPEPELTTLLPAVLNAAGRSPASVTLCGGYAVRTAPLINVHPSDVPARQPIRPHSYVSAVAPGVIVGLRVDGYLLALAHLSQL